MKPDVISERLRDWGYQDVSPEWIERRFREDKDIMASAIRLGAFCMTQQAEYRIKKTLKMPAELMFGRTILFGLVVAASISLFVLLAIIAYGSVTERKGVQDFSFPEFRERTDFDAPSTTETERAKHLLFFITEVTRLKPDMTAQAIAERLVDQGYTKSSGASIKKALDLDKDVMVSPLDSNAYQLNPLYKAKYEEKLDLKFPSSEHLTLDWLWRHVPWLGWASIIGAFVGSVSIAFAFGYKLALHAPPR